MTKWDLFSRKEVRMTKLPGGKGSQFSRNGNLGLPVQALTHKKAASSFENPDFFDSS